MKYLLPSLALLFALACASGAHDSLPAEQPHSTAPRILTQPADQSVSPGFPATFFVKAEGSGLTYQWSWNGSDILGATQSAYFVASAIPADNQSTFQVKVTNSFGTTTSVIARLRVNPSPRAPMEGDLRFKDIDAFPFSLQTIRRSNLLDRATHEESNVIGTPLQLGGNSMTEGGPLYRASWFYHILGLPAGAPDRTTAYQSGQLKDLQRDLEEMPQATVITSLDILSPHGLYALSAVTTDSSNRYSRTCASVTPAELQAAADQLGARGGVITALSFNSDQVFYVSYDRTGDATSVYEAKVIAVTVDTLIEKATTLSSEGYMITALGGNCKDGYMLVGTRVQGDSLPRLIAFATSGGENFKRGFAVVGCIFNDMVQDPLNYEIWIAQQ